MTWKKARPVAAPALLSRRRFMLAAGAAPVAAALGGFGRRDAAAQEITYFRIGGGAVGSRLYQLAGTVAAAITNPPGAESCDKNGPCGVPGLVGLAQTTSGSIENLLTLKDGSIESAIVQGDLAAAAVAGADAFKAAGPFPELRALARLGGMAVQIAVAPASSIQGPADLRGQRRFPAIPSEFVMTAAAWWRQTLKKPRRTLSLPLTMRIASPATSAVMYCPRLRT